MAARWWLFDVRWLQLQRADCTVFGCSRSNIEGRDVLTLLWGERRSTAARERRRSSRMHSSKSRKGLTTLTRYLGRCRRTQGHIMTAFVRSAGQRVLAASVNRGHPALGSVGQSSSATPAADQTVKLGGRPRSGSQPRENIRTPCSVPITPVTPSLAYLLCADAHSCGDDAASARAVAQLLCFESAAAERRPGPFSWQGATDCQDQFASLRGGLYSSA